MNIAFIVLLFIFLLIILMFTEVIRIIFTFTLDSNRAEINLTIFWLYPFLKILVSNESGEFILSAFLFNRKAFRKVLGTGKEKTHVRDLIKYVKLINVNANADYGFRNPFTTGVVCGAVNIASQFINIDSINHNPDFTADTDYVHVDGSAKVNPGFTLVRIFQSQKTKNKLKEELLWTKAHH